MTSETQNQTTENSTELLDGVKILIARMGTHPEDFVPNLFGDMVQKTPKFYAVAQGLSGVVLRGDLSELFTHLTAEEKTALVVAYRAMMRQAFTAGVIARLFEEKQDEDEGLTLKYKTQGRYQKAVLAPTPSHLGTAVAKQEGAMVNPWK